MKAKFLLLLSGLFVGVSIWAQTITIAPKVDAVGGPIGDETIDAHTSFTNGAISDADSMFNWTFITKDLPSGWDYNFCDVNDCYLGTVSSSPVPFKVKRGATTNAIKGTFYYFGNMGTGTLRVVFTSTTNPSLTDTFTMIAKGWATGLNNLKRNASEVSFFPNPAKDNIIFKYPSAKSIEVSVYNVLGSKVKSFNHQGAESVVNISDLQKGIYFIRFNDHGTVISKSFTKSE